MTKHDASACTPCEENGQAGPIPKRIKLPFVYLRFLLGMFISRLGDSLFAFAIPWISYELTQSSIVMGSMYAVSVLPIVLFGPVAGSLVDRWDRKQLMLFTDIARALLVAAIPLLHYADVLELSHLYAISFVLTILSLMFDVSVVAIIPSLAPGQLTRANASYQLTQQIAELAGPMLAGAVIAAVGGFNTLRIDSVSFTGTLTVLLVMPSFAKPKPRTTLKQILKDIREGFNWLLRSKLNVSFSIQAMTGNFGYSAAFGMLMFYLLNTLHLSSRQSSLNYTLIGLGGVIGSLLAVPLEQRLRRGILIPLLLSIGATGFIQPFLARTRHRFFCSCGL